MPEGSEVPAAVAARIVTAYVRRNSLPRSELPALIGSVHSALESLNETVDAEPAAPKPAVPIKKSVTPDYLICLEDGLPFKALRRHLSERYGMTPAQYRQRWGLPPNYPMTAPNYSERRSQWAKSAGFGRNPGRKLGRLPKAGKPRMKKP